MATRKALGLLLAALISATVLIARLLAAQQPTPTFDVVSIHVVPPNTPPVLRDMDFTPVLPGGQYLDSRALLPFMISFAYDVKNPSTQLLGLPKWASEQSYAVAAKPAQGFPALPPAENYQQVRLMMRAMLEDRFHLQLHVENRQVPIFKLEIARGGIKIQEVDPPVAPEKESPVGAAWGERLGRMIGNKSTTLGIAAALTVMLNRTVIDETGLKGYYDFDVRWSSPDLPDGPPPGPGLGAEGTGLLMSALQNQFGLRLTNTTGSVQYWVVDHIEPPTAN
jgi:uncharacterized protein (TIGR03435 family)